MLAYSQLYRKGASLKKLATAQQIWLRACFQECLDNGERLAALLRRRVTQQRVQRRRVGIAEQHFGVNVERIGDGKLHINRHAALAAFPSRDLVFARPDAVG